VVHVVRSYFCLSTSSSSSRAAERTQTPEPASSKQQTANSKNHQQLGQALSKQQTANSKQQRSPTLVLQNITSISQQCTMFAMYIAHHVLQGRAARTQHRTQHSNTCPSHPHPRSRPLRIPTTISHSLARTGAWGGRRASATAKEGPGHCIRGRARARQPTPHTPQGGRVRVRRGAVPD
jgi:hypothetical protein